jgi:glycosyltransferase involved in cell wall biosynthesis
VLARDTYDLSRFVFLGLVPRLELAKLFALSDLHVYLTVPFVLSWSLLDALACGAKVLASNTAPVREVIQHGRTGLLVDFFDIEAMCDVAGDVLDRPDDYRHLASGGVGLIQDCYSLEACLPVLRSLYLEEATKGTGADRRRGSLHLTVSPARS